MRVGQDLSCRSETQKLRVAAVGDLHYGRRSDGGLRELFVRVSKEADVFVLCGDLTDHGLATEAVLLAADVRQYLTIPVVAVLGNHDVEREQQGEISRILTDSGVTMLDDEPAEIASVGFAGVKGFCGGFGRSMLEPWGEPVIKRFVEEAVNEARRLESHLARLRTERRIAVLHYAPIHETVEGEPPELVPYLGTGRLSEPINTFGATLVVHGHAHHGKPEGHTTAGIPVHNCALPLRRRLFPEKPYFLAEL